MKGAEYSKGNLIKYGSIIILYFQSDIFRSIDGKCNNLKNPLWGSKTVSMRRILLSISNLYKIDQYYSLALGKQVTHMF